METMLQKIRISYGHREGVTLLEMVVSVAIFSVLMLLSVGAILGVMNAERKAVVIKDVVDNARFSLELMTRELRTAQKYKWDGSSPCLGQLGNGLKFISYNQGSAETRFYYLKDTDGDGVRDAIFRVAMSDDITPVNCGLAQQFTSEEIVVDQFSVIIGGTLVGQSDGQPHITISMRVRGKSAKYGADTHINLQTTITSRVRDR